MQLPAIVAAAAVALAVVDTWSYDHWLSLCLIYVLSTSAESSDRKL